VHDYVKGGRESSLLNPLPPWSEEMGDREMPLPLPQKFDAAVVGGDAAAVGAAAVVAAVMQQASDVLFDERQEILVDSSFLE
jgi:hypothetical protein